MKSAGSLLNRSGPVDCAQMSFINDRASGSLEIDEASIGGMIQIVESDGSSRDSQQKASQSFRVFSVRDYRGSYGVRKRMRLENDQAEVFVTHASANQGVRSIDHDGRPD